MSELQSFLSSVGNTLVRELPGQREEVVRQVASESNRVSALEVEAFVVRVAATYLREAFRAEDVPADIGLGWVHRALRRKGVAWRDVVRSCSSGAGKLGGCAGVARMLASSFEEMAAENVVSAAFDRLTGPGLDFDHMKTVMKEWRKTYGSLIPGRKSSINLLCQPDLAKEVLTETALAQWRQRR